MLSKVLHDILINIHKLDRRELLTLHQVVITTLKLLKE